MTASSPSIPPSSFDPAIHLHSETHPAEPPSESFSDELEALHLQRLENIRNKVVIQHRAWNLSDIFHSDEDVRPYTPTKSRQNTKLLECSPIGTLNILPSSPPTVKMPFISSPAAFPSSAPSPESQKRKNEVQSQPSEPKRQKIMGGFLDDDDSSDELDAFNDAQLKSQFDIEEQIIEQPPAPHPEIPRLSQITPGPIPSIDSIPDRTTSISSPSAPLKRVPVSIQIKTCSGKTLNVTMKKSSTKVSYERLVASRSTTAPGRAQRSFYGIEIHKLLDEASKEPERAERARSPAKPTVQPSIECALSDQKSKKLAAAMWTEKYRARKYTELIGDERTHRSILRWLRAWDPIVYPNLARAKPKKPRYGKEEEEERPHRKVLLLCGPPGLGKTTLAHVCARQAGYEVLEINASDERSRDVVKGRIRDALGTENVKGMNVEVGDQKVRKVGRPVCVVVDEVDGVVSGSGGAGEGGFMKALIDLVVLDQKNSARSSEQVTIGKKRKGDNFRFLRPLILVCNDVYHPSLRPLRSSSIAEIVHVRNAPLENVVSRMKSIFTTEGIPSDNDGVRRLCEASWGLAKRRQGAAKTRGTAEGDIRSVLVAAEWVAHKLRGESTSTVRLTKTWLEQHVLAGGGEGGAFFKGLSRGGVRDIIDRVFTEGAGFPDVPIEADSLHNPFDRLDSKIPVDVASIKKRHAIGRLREMIDASGDHDRCTSECFSSYLLQSYQDDTFLSKPNAAYEWLHFHDTISSKVYSAHEWELGAYLSQSAAAFHLLFATAQGRTQYKEPDEEEEEQHPFAGPRAEFAAFEAQKQNQAVLTGFQSSLSAPMIRIFRSPDCLATELLPNLILMLSPDVKPVVVRGGGEQRSTASVRRESERALVESAVRVMTAMNIKFDKVRVEGEGGTHGGWAYRMEPPLDSLVAFSKTGGISTSSGPVRYAIRQVLDQEYRKETMRKQSEAFTSLKKSSGKSTDGQNPAEAENKKRASNGTTVKRDFFGRIIQEPVTQSEKEQTNPAQSEDTKGGRKVWVTYHDGFSNAVRKSISLGELLAGL